MQIYSDEYDTYQHYVDYSVTASVEDWIHSTATKN
jgi:hypothetical protein